MSVGMWSGQNVRPLNKHEYILDVATEAELVDSNYSLWFRRVIWSQPLKFENELGVTMHYNQVRLQCFSCMKRICVSNSLCVCSDLARLSERSLKCSAERKSERAAVPPDLQTGSPAAQSQRHRLHPQHVRKQFLKKAFLSERKHSRVPSQVAIIPVTTA